MEATTHQFVFLGGSAGPNVPLRPHEAAVQTLAIARLMAAQAEADGFGPDNWQVMERLQGWAVRLPHDRRLARLRELGRRTDDLYVGWWLG